MSDGYVRQSSAQIVTGAVINAAPLNAEFNALQNAFDATVGHVHDGTVGGGGLIPSLIYTATSVGGTANAITVTSTSPTNFVLSQGVLLTVTPIYLTTSTTVTLAVNGGSIYPIMKISAAGIVSPVDGDIAPEFPLILQWNAAGSYWLATNIVIYPYTTPISTNQNITFANLELAYIATASLNLTIDHSTNLGTDWYITVFAQNGNVTVIPYSSDRINGGTAGVSVVIPKGNFSFINTDANGNVYVTSTNYYISNTFQVTGNFPVTLVATGSTSVTLPTSGTLLSTASIITPAQGGTGVNNGSSTITIGGNLSTTGAFTTNFTVTGNTSVTLPTSGTLLSTASIITPAQGGTGVNNGTNTITLGGNLSTAGAFTTSGAFGVTVTATNTTSVTLPTSGTLATLAGTETLTNKTLTAPIIATIVNTGILTLPSSTDTLVGRATTDTLTNKTFDTAGAGNVLKINGTQVSAVTGTGSIVLSVSPALTGTPTVPTAAVTTNTTQIASTAFVLANQPAGGTVFTSSGTFTTAANINANTVFKFIITGGGGGGAGATSNINAGGGAGATAVYYVSGLSPSTGYTITVGTGGTGGANAAGSNGNSSSIVIGATTVTAPGGSGGSTNSAGGIGGLGGSIPTNGTMNILGGSGGGGYVSGNIWFGGYGGASYWGGGASGVSNGTGASAIAGLAGQAYGSGGGGSTANSTASGGNGANGIVVVEW